MGGTVKLGDREVPVFGLNMEKTLRLIDSVAQLTQSSTSAQEFIERWVDEQAAKLRAKRLELPDAERDLQIAQIAEEVRAAFPDWDEDLVAREAQHRFEEAEPDTWQQLTRLLPYVWAEARNELVNVLAIAVVDNEQLLAADEAGRMDDYWRSVSRDVRHHMRPSQAPAVLQALAEEVRVELRDEALGEAVAALVSAAGELVGVVSGSGSSEPSGSTASAATTDGPAPPSSTSTQPASSSP